MRVRMKEHSEETNELFNLMARQIKKRGEERVNLYAVDELDSGMDEYLIDKEIHQESEEISGDNTGRNSSAGNSPPKWDVRSPTKL
jgi:hypothetical protein